MSDGPNDAYLPDNWAELPIPDQAEQATGPDAALVPEIPANQGEDTPQEDT